MMKGRRQILVHSLTGDQPQENETEEEGQVASASYELIPKTRETTATDFSMPMPKILNMSIQYWRVEAGWVVILEAKLQILNCINTL